MRKVLIACLVLFGGSAAQAQAIQWNQIVTDRPLEKAFYRALREVSVDYINQAETDGRPAAIVFVDSELRYPLLLTSSNYRQVLLNALHSKLNYLLRYQAKTTAGVDIPVGSGGFVLGIPGIYGRDGEVDAASGGAGAEIPGDGGMMLCPINKDGLEFMIGGLAIASLGDRILGLTYEYYGYTPEDGSVDRDRSQQP